MKVILISGKAQHGKDTAATIMKEKLVADGHKTLITHYADLLKYICHSYFDWDGQKDENGRHLLQYVGTDIIRKQNPDLWVNFVSDMLGYFKDNWEYVIIPDCRFPNEISVIKERGFDTTHIRISRIGFSSPLSEEQKNHKSETALDDVKADFYIENNGSDDFEKAVKCWIEEILYEKH